MQKWIRLGVVLMGIGAAEEGGGSSPPPLNGRLLFHRYSGYGSYDSQIYVYDFEAKSLTCLTGQWAIDHAMNAHFSPDGTQIVFMGLPKGRRGAKDWDVFLWRVGGSDLPENLTEGNGLRDEDPNFAPDGKSIVFKQAGRLAHLDLTTKKVQRAVFERPVEQSMPTFVDGGRRVVAMENSAADGDLYAYERDGTNRTAVAAEPNVQEYFPVRWDTARLLYVRWCSAGNRNDQICAHSWKTGQNESLPFCKADANYSDPCPADERWVFFSSTRAGGSGGYDLYIGDSGTGAVRELGIAGLNTKAEELGASYLPRLHPARAF